eukprot:GFYU01032623.1.p1 GENE.GFYU01032623.1~~GFYU01032623.1.p1  ORF type:complete len:137 (+),score=15.01 GFYU01032623.1:34-444(+)
MICVSSAVCMDVVRTTPISAKLTAEQYWMMNKRFHEAYKQIADLPHVRDIFTEVRQYKEDIEAFQVSDRMVSHEGYRFNAFKVLFYLLVRCVYWAFCLPFAIAGFVINAPVGLIARWLAWRTAKSEGKDIVATYKV